MINFGHIKIQCNSCNNESKFGYEELNSIYANKKFDGDWMIEKAMEDTSLFNAY